MRKVYICSPYRAKDGAELDRNIDYAQQLTRQALEAGLAPITPHLYMTQCMDDKKPEERARGMAAGLALLKGCDFVIAGVKYGITEGMDREIHTANMLGIAVIDANQIKRHLEYEEKRQERVASDYAKLHKCKHCYECRLCSLMGYEIKIVASYYEDVVSGKKSFELRKNDRGYKQGDSLKMLEFKDGKHTGRTIDADIIYMLEDYTGLTEGYCILGIRVTDYTGKVSETDTESGAVNV